MRPGGLEEADRCHETRRLLRQRRGRGQQQRQPPGFGDRPGPGDGRGGRFPGNGEDAIAHHSGSFLFWVGGGRCMRVSVVNYNSFNSFVVGLPRTFLSRPCVLLVLYAHDLP